MPLFNFKCNGCGQTLESLMSVAQMRKGIKCLCGEMMERQYDRVVTMPDYSDVRHFGKLQYADARRRKCGIGAS